ncbi:MAG: hypothetical protein LBI34_01175 [Puniceicoccales bacterium]|jgi:hypothetical protein|nr:hypothetical protein [Puniceicoccales bacterium]
MAQNFYRRQSNPQFADTSASSQSMGQRINRVVAQTEAIALSFAQQQEAVARDKETLHRSDFNDIAQKAAIDAYNRNPNDRAAYERDFAAIVRSSGFQIPLDQAGAYGAMANGAKERYYWTIAANQNEEQKTELRGNALRASDYAFQHGLGLIAGQQRDPFPQTALGEAFGEATAPLLETSADGTPLFSDGERAARLGQMNYQVLSNRVEAELTGDMPISALKFLEDPNFNYSVALDVGAGGTMTFSKNELPPELRNQFDEETRGRMETLLKTQNDLAKGDYGQRIYNGQNPFLMGDKKQREALEYVAQLQVARTPVGNGTMSLHVNNLAKYANNYAFIPSPYVNLLNGLIQSDNPEAAARGAILLNQTLAQAPAAAKGFDDGVLNRATMLDTLVSAGTAPAEDRYIQAVYHEGGTLQFTFDFPVYEAASVELYVDNQQWSFTEDYSVVINGLDGGLVTLLKEPRDGALLTIVGATPYIRTETYVPSVPDVSTMNVEGNKTIYRLQQLHRDILGCLKNRREETENENTELPVQDETVVVRDSAGAVVQVGIGTNFNGLATLYSLKPFAGTAFITGNVTAQ